LKTFLSTATICTDKIHLLMEVRDSKSKCCVAVTCRTQNGQNKPNHITVGMKTTAVTIVIDVATSASCIIPVLSKTYFNISTEHSPAVRTTGGISVCNCLPTIH
jgi:hypothetical protein